MATYPVTISKDNPVGRISLYRSSNYSVSRRNSNVGSICVENIKSSMNIGARPNTIFVKQKRPVLMQTEFLEVQDGQENIEISSKIISHAEKFLSAESNRLTTSDNIAPKIYSGTFIGAEPNVLYLTASAPSAASVRLSSIGDFELSTISDISDQRLSEITYIEY